jgi:hypothetical protein
MRSVTGAEPTAKFTGAIAQGHATQVGANAQHDQPFAIFVERAVFIGRRKIWFVVIAVIAVNQIAHINGPSRFNFALCATANEDWLALPQNGDLCTRFNIGYIDADRGQGQNIR